MVRKQIAIIDCSNVIWLGCNYVQTTLTLELANFLLRNLAEILGISQFPTEPCPIMPLEVTREVPNSVTSATLGTGVWLV